MTDSLPSTLAELLRIELERLDWTQTDFRAALASVGVNVGKSTVSMWLSGKRLPERHTLEAVLDALRIFGDLRLHAYGLVGRQPDGNAS